MVVDISTGEIKEIELTLEEEQERAEDEVFNIKIIQESNFQVLRQLALAAELETILDKKLTWMDKYPDIAEKDLDIPEPIRKLWKELKKANG